MGKLKSKIGITRGNGTVTKIPGFDRLSVNTKRLRTTINFVCIRIWIYL